MTKALAYAEKLREAGVDVTLADYPDMVHDFIYMQAVLPQAQEALHAAAAALKAAVRGNSPLPSPAIRCGPIAESIFPD